MNLLQLKQLIDSDDMRTFITTHIEDNVQLLSLSCFKKKYNIDTIIALQQIALLQKAKIKIPLWHKLQCIFTKKMYEQCTSANVATYKATLFKGRNFVDLTAGLGVDAYYISFNFTYITLIEPDKIHAEILKSNFKKLNSTNNVEILNTDAETFLQTNNQQFDLIYLDPDRRSDNGERHLSAASYSPNIDEVLRLAKLQTKQCAIKVSPMLDASWIVKTWQPNSLYCIAEKNEMKEMLMVFDFEKMEPTTNIIAVEMNGDKVQEYDGSKVKNVSTKNGQKYFYESGVSLIKSNHAAQLFAQMEIEKINYNATFGISNYFQHNFIGRKFELLISEFYKEQGLKLIIEKYKLESANITCRDFPLQPEALRKKYKLKDGGNFYLFFAKNLENELVFFLTQKVTAKIAESTLQLL